MKNCRNQGSLINLEFFEKLHKGTSFLLGTADTCSETQTMPYTLAAALMRSVTFCSTGRV